MSEIEKLMQNAGVKKKRHKCPGREYDENGEICSYYIEEYYPPFTAEKQLELIKWLASRKGYPDYGKFFGGDFDYYIQFYSFDEALAKTVNKIWQSLTEEERNSIKEILNG